MITPRIHSFLDDVFEDLPESQSLRDFKEEVAANLGEKMADYRTAGLSEPDAYYKAISSLGDIRTVYLGQQKPRKKRAWFIVMAVSILLIVTATDCRSRNTWFQQSPPGYESFWQEGARSSTVLLTAESIQIEYDVLIEGGILFITVHDSLGKSLWEGMFPADDSGQVVMALANKGLAVVTVRGKAKARYRLNVSDVK